MLHTMRHIQTSHINTEEIKTAIQTKTVDKIIILEKRKEQING